MCPEKNQPLNKTASNEESEKKEGYQHPLKKKQKKGCVPQTNIFTHPFPNTSTQTKKILY